MVDGLCINPDVLIQLDRSYRHQAMARAATWRLLHTIHTEQLINRSHRPWLAQQGCKLLCQSGHFLVSLGLWLERRGTARAT